MIERKHIIVVASLLVVGAGWFFGTRFFRTEAPPVVEGPDTFPFVQCQVKMGGESVEWANIMFDDPEHPTRKVIGFYDGERDIYRFTTRNGATEMSGVPQGTYTVVIKPGRQTRVKIPTKYGDPKTSALTVSIQEGQNVLPPFELTP